jgi:hypothetical protein
MQEFFAGAETSAADPKGFFEEAGNRSAREGIAIENRSANSLALRHRHQETSSGEISCILPLNLARAAQRGATGWSFVHSNFEGENSIQSNQILVSRLLRSTASPPCSRVLSRTASFAKFCQRELERQASS